MKVNLSVIVARPSLKSDEMKMFDLHEDIADRIYQEGVTEQEYNFAVRVSQEGKDLMEINEQEVEILDKYINSYPFWLKKAIIDSIMNINQTQIPVPPAEEESGAQWDEPQPTIVSAADVNKSEEVIEKKKPKKKK